MKKFFKNILLIAFIFLALGSKSLAETLTFKSTLDQAINHSFDLKISNLDIDISRAELKATKADLYPLLNFQLNSEHNDDLSKNGGFAYAGTTVLSPYTQYRNMASVTASYNLFDFGATNRKVLIAKKTVDQKQIVTELQLKDLKLKILEIYTKTLQSSEEIRTKSQMLDVYEEMFKAKERLFLAGISDKISVMDEAINIAKAQNDIENSKLTLKTALEDLSYYTQKKYNPVDIEVLDLEDFNVESNIVPISNKGNEPLKAKVEDKSTDFSFNPSQSPEARYYDFELEKKKAELQMIKRQRYPAFRLYASYSFYGQDPSQYFASVRDVSQRNLTVGLSGTFAIFDGFKNRANCQKAALEIKKIELQKEKKLSELQAEYEKTYAAYDTYVQELSIKKNMLARVKEKETALTRMCENGIIDRNKTLQSRADLLSQQFELEKNIVDISSKIKQIQILTGRDM